VNVPFSPSKNFCFSSRDIFWHTVIQILSSPYSRQSRELSAYQLTANTDAYLFVDGAQPLFSGNFPVDSNAIPHSSVFFPASLTIQMPISV